MSKQRWSIARLIQLLALVSVLVVTVAAKTPESPTFTATTRGCAGVVAVPQTEGFKIYGNTVQFPQRTVWRSQCYGSSVQRAWVNYRMWGYNLSTKRWVQFANQWKSVDLGVGRSGTLPGWSASVAYRFVSVDVDVQWWTLSGSYIGGVVVDYNQTSDYRCACSVFGGNPDVGAFMDFGPY